MVGASQLKSVSRTRSGVGRRSAGPEKRIIWLFQIPPTILMLPLLFLIDGLRTMVIKFDKVVVYLNDTISYWLPAFGMTY
jgi:hypothetical protein